MAFEVVAQIVGHVRLAGGDDEPASGVFEAVEVVRRQHAGVGDDDQLLDAVAGLELLNHRDQGLGLCLVALVIRTSG